MSMKSLLPGLWSADDSRADPFQNLQKEIDRVFSDFRNTGFTSTPQTIWGNSGQSSLMPRIDISETDTEIDIEVELPGVDKKDVDVTVVDQLLTIKGTKKSEDESKEKNYHLVERSQGTFERTIPLGFEVQSNKVNAQFNNGVLTVKVSKPPESANKAKKIKVTEVEST